MSVLIVTYAVLSQNLFSDIAVQDVDWWLMYRHDPQHTGYSTSKAPNTNRTSWTKQFGDWVRSSPAVHNNVVFIGSDDGVSLGKICALNVTTGEEIWSHTTEADVVSSAAVAYSRVYIGSEDRKFYCLNESNGDFLWSFQTGGIISSSPCVTDNKVVFGSNDCKLYCLDTTTGNHLWNFSTLGAVQSSPAVADGKVFFGSFDRKVYALDLNSGTLIWSYTAIGSISVSPSVVNGKVFIASSKTIHCFNAPDGDLVWSYTTDGIIHSSPAIAGGNLYIGCDYRMYCLSVNGQSKWNFTTGDSIYSSPAVADGKVFFGSNDKKVYCLNATTGTLVWSYDTGGYVRTSSPAVTNKYVFVASSYYPPFSGKLFAFGPANAPPVAANLTIIPSSPVTADNLIGTYDYYDEDGDPENGTEIRWYKDGSLQPTCNDTLIVPFTATAKGQVWYFTVQPKDGKEFGTLQTSSTITIHNSLPSIDSVMITPDSAYTNDTLIANPSGWLDTDGDPEGYSYQWQKYEAGSWQNIIGATSQTLSHENFVKGDLIKILCIPYDGESYGDAKEDTITISNSPPVINSYYPLNNPTISEGESQEFNITKSDTDVDQLTVEWYLNGTKMLEASDSYIYVADFESAGTYNVTVAVSDDDDQTKHEWLLTVTDVERDVAVTNVTLSKMVVGQSYSLEVNVTVENQGTNNEIFNVTIYANTTMIQTKEIVLTNKTYTLATFAWNTTGFVKGNYTISAYAWPVPGETDTDDNTFTNGWVVVTIPGDVDGDFDVNIYDIVKICVAYGSKIGDPKYDANCDIDGDFDIDIYDVVVACTHYGQKDP